MIKIRFSKIKIVFFICFALFGAIQFLSDTPINIVYIGLLVFFGAELLVEIEIKKEFFKILIASFSPLLLTVESQYIILGSIDIKKLPFNRWVLNYLVILFITLILIAIIGRVTTACAVSHAFIILVSVIDYFTFTFRDNEITLGDLHGWRTGLSVAGGYTFYFNSRIIFVTLFSIMFFFISKIFQV